jgi:hypothetical protein
MPEEQEVDAEHDGNHRKHAKHDASLSSHCSTLEQDKTHDASLLGRTGDSDVVVAYKPRSGGSAATGRPALVVAHRGIRLMQAPVKASISS